LKQAIETMVARKIEASFDAGVRAHLIDMLTLGMGDIMILGIDMG
jgi:hypothetical protein